MLGSIIYLKALCSGCLPPFYFDSLSLPPLFCVFVSLCLLHSLSPHLHVTSYFFPSTLAVANYLPLPPFRSPCGGVVPCARPQPQAGRPEGDAERGGRYRSRDRRLPPQWCGHTAQSLPGGAAGAPAHTQTLSGSPEDRRCVLTHEQALIMSQDSIILINLKTRNKWIVPPLLPLQ